MLSSVHFHVKTKQGKPVCSHKIIFESQAGSPCALLIHIPYLEVKPNRSIRFHIKSFSRTMQGKPVRSHMNSPLGVKPDNRYTPHSKSPLSKATGPTGMLSLTLMLGTYST